MIQYERVCFCLCAQLITESVCYYDDMYAGCFLEFRSLLCASVFLVAPPHSVLSAPLATHAYLFDVNESFRRANKAKSMEISKTNCNLLFIARCMARAGAGGTERVTERRRKGKRDPIVAGPHRLPSVGVHTYILYSIYYRIYTIYSHILYAVCAELRCP